VGSLYARGPKLWCRYKDASGQWASCSTPFQVGEEDRARRYLRKLEEIMSAPGTVLPTVAAYAETWLADRRALGLRSVDDDAARLNLHALPALGTMHLDEVRPRHLRDLVLDLRKRGELAPRTIRHVFATLATMFRTAIADELIESTPCVLSRGVLPKKVDKDPEWRAGAIFTRAEVERLLSDERLPTDRQVLYARRPAPRRGGGSSMAPLRRRRGAPRAADDRDEL
jgi:hypothetical protein